MADKYTHMFSDNYRVSKSHLASPDDGTYNIVRLPKKALVMNVYVWVTTAWVAGGHSPVMSIGFANYSDVSDDSDAFLGTADITLTTAAMYTMLADSTADHNGGYYFSDGGCSITMTTDDDTCTTVGTADIFVHYTIIH